VVSLPADRGRKLIPNSQLKKENWKKTRPTANCNLSKRRLKTAESGPKVSQEEQHHAFTAVMTLGDRINRNGARPVRIPQAGAVPGSVPRWSPPNRLEVPPSSCRARGRGGHETGRVTNINIEKEKERHGITIMHWNAEGIQLKQNDWIGKSCITTTSKYATYKKHVFKLGSPLKSEDARSSEMIDKEERKEE
jgi:hypothetical protein